MCFENAGLLESPPSWEVLALVAHYLDPKTLAIASCVSKSWFFSMSSDHLWQPLCAAHFPSLSNLKTACPPLPYHHLYAMGYAAAKRRLKSPSKPRVALESLLFAIDLRTGSGDPVVTVAKRADQTDVDANGLFRFDIDVEPRMAEVKAANNQEMRITWNVVLSLRGWEAVFTMMDCGGKLSLVAGVEGWFSEELPLPGCCSRDVASGIVADLKVGFYGRRGTGQAHDDGDEDEDEKITVKKVSVGMLSIVNWRYVSVDDALRFLQHFLVPCPLCTA